MEARLRLCVALVGIGVALGAVARADGLAAFRVEGGNAIPGSLTGKPGDAARGQLVAVDRAQGNCLACHGLPVDQPLQGNVGPDLRGVGARLTEGEIRLRVVNPKILNAQTAMPAYYRVDGLTGVRKDLQGKPILSAEQIEDVVAYLKGLKQ